MQCKVCHSFHNARRSSERMVAFWFAGVSMSGWHKSSRHDRGYGAEWDKARVRILARDLHLCQPCLKTGRPTPATEVDHITPKAKGGTDDDNNLQAICHPCHAAKTKVEIAQAQGRKVRLTYNDAGFPAWPA